MKILSLLIVLTTGIITLVFYSTINYMLFADFGFVPTGRIIFTSYFGYLDYLVLPIGLGAGIFVLRRTQKEISPEHLFNFGLKTTILAAVLFSAFIFVYLRFIDIDYFQKLIVLIKQSDTSVIESTPLKSEMIEHARIMQENELLRSPYFYGIANFFAYLVIGLSGTLFFTILLKKKQIG